MSIADSLIQFFGIDMLTQTATFIDVINCVLRIGVAVWLTLFICKWLFAVTTVADRRFW